ncbi:hypothetical protein [Brachyspira catarrhinii]|uniref:Lipoprotein n=1 Tax=Brachyspira catarrhinii TaxID=2528966 RepID=A0ABY2TT13_9SPIR|nr:hypothetical protein [Brachyspira catarrhinii]TKZ36020.1 hypothetical protein EZH24_02255 [Brachyspira catarrhinii]
MLRKILLSSILILAVGCGSKSIKNGVYDGVIDGLLGKESHKYIISNNKIEDIDLKNNYTNYYSKVKDKNENDKDIVYYITETEIRGSQDKQKSYIGVKQTNDNSIIVYGVNTFQYNKDLRDAFISYMMGVISVEMINSITTIHSIDINKPSIFEKVEE